MELIARLWKNFRTQPEIWFFYGFLLTFTLTIRKVLFFFPLRGEFNEYSGIYLYLSDIFLGLVILAWIITILYNKISILSICRNIFFKKTECSTPAPCCENVPRLPRSKEMFHMEHFFCYWGGTLPYLILPLVLVVWSFISFIWAENKIVSIFRSIKILEFYLLYVFVLIRFFYPHTHDNPCICDKTNKTVGVGVNWNVPSQKECSTWNILRDKCGTILKKIFGFVMIIGLFQAIIGIIQFILQHSIGLFWLKESLISQNISGVAKIIFNGETLIRAYGLFPHPNILGGFLLFSIFISLLYYKMFHTCPVAKNCSIPEGMFHVEHPTGQAWNNSFASGVEHFQNLRGGTLIKIFLGIQLLALILTFSKSAILGLFLGLAYIVYMIVPPQKECSTWNILRGRYGTIIGFFKKKKKLILITSLIVVFTAIIAKPDLHSFFIKSLNERSVYTNVSHGTIWNNPVLGIGNGQFVISMENLPIIKENWMLEPVHNVFLLVWSELGIIGLLLLILFILYVLRMFCSANSNNVPPQKQENCSTWNNFLLRGKCGTIESVKNTFGAIFIGILFIMFFDHYLWDIQQGSFLLWMTMGFLVGAGKTEDNLTK